MKAHNSFANFLIIMGIVVLFTSCVSQKDSIPGVLSVRTTLSNRVYKAIMDVPEFEGEDHLNTLISDKINDWLDDFIIEADLYQSTAEIAGLPFTFKNQWSVTINSDDYASILLTAYQFTGGANGVDKMASFTWDKLNKKEMTIEDFLPLVLPEPSLESLAQACRKELNIALQAETNPSIIDMIYNGTEPVPENYDIFTISDQGLTIYFEKYQVAPGSEGTQAVLLPYLK